jgi:hypothetical protein
LWLVCTVPTRQNRVLLLYMQDTIVQLNPCDKHQSQYMVESPKHTFMLVIRTMHPTPHSSICDSVFCRVGRIRRTFVTSSHLDQTCRTSYIRACFDTRAERRVLDTTWNPVGWKHTIPNKWKFQLELIEIVPSVRETLSRNRFSCKYMKPNGKATIEIPIIGYKWK